ncbi:MAG: imidazole glycerol phosphate synthase subunit HisH [Oscillospiraceae bacterium]|jgi:glutamine amidotransferase
MGYTAVIDYNVGNLHSVIKALAFLGYEARVTSDPHEIGLAEDIILPGVGAFPEAVDSLRRSGLIDILRAEAGNKPFLGICLGMQLLFSKGEEIRPTLGLGLIPGAVRRIKTSLKLPHIGWNCLNYVNPCPLLKDIPERSYVYFVHSFAGFPESREDLAAVTEYPGEVCAVVSRGNVFGCQFHPEKSGETGLQILKNFKELSI